jgi:hypothetical protein
VCWINADGLSSGSFEYNVIPFGLTNAPAAFQSFMNDIFADVRDDFVVVYLDDILIYSEDPVKHDDHVCLVLECLIQHGLAVHPEKCSFDLTEIDFLGHIISVDGIRMDPAKVAAVKDWTYPKDKKSLQMFLWFANFYRHFIRTFSDLTFPLTHLLLKDAKFDWSSKCAVAFDALKTAFTSFPVLHHYDFDKS